MSGKEEEKKEETNHAFKIQLFTGTRTVVPKF